MYSWVYLKTTSANPAECLSMSLPLEVPACYFAGGSHHSGRGAPALGCLSFSLCSSQTDLLTSASCIRLTACPLVPEDSYTAHDRYSSTYMRNEKHSIGFEQYHSFIYIFISTSFAAVLIQYVHRLGLRCCQGLPNAHCLSLVCVPVRAG